VRGPSNNAPRVVTITPEEATHLLESNGCNRPLNEAHVKRIAKQIEDGKWRFNGDTIKISSTNDILDGQHRLWAIIMSETAVETIVVRGIEPDAFSTIDTLRKPRSGSDVLALVGVTNHRSTISVGLQWLIRWQRKVLEEYRAPANRIENSDIEQAFKDNPGMARAAERANKLRAISNPGLLAFFYFILSNRNPDLAERLMHTLENPSGVGVDDPFFRLRVYFLNQSNRKDALISIALMIKAANAAHKGREVKVLNWRSQGSVPEPFPMLDVGQYDAHLTR
jgi:hypothetical protein